MRDQTVFLLINGKAHGGWESVSITRSLENAAAGFQVSVSERFPGQNQPLRIVPGDACQVRIGDDVVITGYVDRVDLAHGAASHTVSVTGRSKTGLLVDCSVQPPFATITNQTILQIADRLAQPYGVDIVDALKGQTDPIVSYDGINPGDTVFGALSKLAAMKAVMLTDDERGRLLITRAGIARASTALRSGPDGNILTGRGSFDHSQRFRTYYVDGQFAGDGSNPGGSASAEAEDRGASSQRFLMIRSEAQSSIQKARDRARWEASSRMGKAVSITVNAQGWRQENGDLWKINQMVSVKDPLLTIEGELLVVSVTFSLSESGTITTLTLSPKAAFQLIPEDPKGTKDAKIYQLAASGALQ